MKPGVTSRKSQHAVWPLGFEGDDEELARALKAGHPGARAALYDRFAPQVQRLLVRVLGFDHALDELLQEVFLQALSSVSSIEEEARIGPWLRTITVYVARGVIRKRKRRKWLMFLMPSEMPDPPAVEVDHDVRRALEKTYAVLDKLSADSRIAFTLRYIEGLELTEVAEACSCSLATIKRRLSLARRHFFLLAEREPDLVAWIQKGGEQNA